MRRLALALVLATGNAAWPDAPLDDANDVSIEMFVLSLQAEELFSPLFADSVEVGGIAFVDPACDRRFGKHAVVQKRDPVGHPGAKLSLSQMSFHQRAVTRSPNQ